MHKYSFHKQRMRVCLCVILCYLVLVARSESSGLVDPSVIHITAVSVFGDKTVLHHEMEAAPFYANTTCEECAAIDTGRIICERNRLLHLKVLFVRGKKKYNIERNVSCNDAQNQRTLSVNLNSTLRSIEVRVDPWFFQYSYVMYLDGEGHYDKVIITKQKIHVFDHLKMGTSYRICGAVIDDDEKTGRYKCKDYCTDSIFTGPISDVKVASHSYEVMITLYPPKCTNDIPEGYIVNLRDPENTCRSFTMAFRSYHPGYNCSAIEKHFWYENIGTLKFSNLKAFTNYTAEIYPFRINRSSMKSSVSFRTLDGKSGPVSSLRVTELASSVRLECGEPTEPFGIIRLYSVKVSWIKTWICYMNDIPVFETRSESNIIDIPPHLMKKCERYYLEVVPVNGWGEGLAAAMYYRHLEGRPYNNSDIKANFLNPDVLEIRLNDSRSDCKDLQYIFEVANTLNLSECVTYILSEEKCPTRFTKMISDTSNCFSRQFSSNIPSNGRFLISWRYKLSVTYRIKVWTILNENITLDPLSPVFTTNKESKTFALEVKTLFYNLKTDEASVSFKKVCPQGSSVEKTCDNVSNDMVVNLTCKLWRISKIKVEMVRNESRISIPFNLSCGTEDPHSTIHNLMTTYVNNSIHIYWSVTLKGTSKYVILWMDRVSSSLTYVTSSRPSHVISSVPGSSWYQICVAAIDSRWATSKYSCAQYSTTPDPVENLQAFSKSREIYVSWGLSKENAVEHHGFMVNVTEPGGRCLTMIIHMGGHCVVVKALCHSTLVLRWASLRTLRIDQLIPGTKYVVSISAIIRNVLGPPQSVSISTKDAEKVSSLSVIPFGRFILISFMAPRDSGSRTMTYRLRVTLNRENMCTYRYIPIFEEVINATSKMVSLKGQTDCCEYLVEVTPVHLCNHTEKVGSTSSFLYRPKIRKPAALRSVDVKILSHRLLKVSWKGSIEEDGCSNFGFMVESSSENNSSDCMTWILTQNTCSRLMKEVGVLSNCSKKAYFRIDPGVIKDDILLQVSMKMDKKFRVRLWRISDHVEMLLDKDVFFETGKSSRSGSSSCCSSSCSSGCNSSCSSSSSSSSSSKVAVVIVVVEVLAAAVEVVVVVVLGVGHEQLHSVIFSECFSDCYSSSYAGIRSGTTTGDLCLPWRYHPQSVYRSLRSNICHFERNLSKRPWCLVDIKGNLEKCDIPPCNEDSKDVSCVSLATTSTTKESISLKWSLLGEMSAKVRGYITILHNSGHECERYNIQECPNCIRLLRLSPQIQGFYQSCKEGGISTSWNHTITFKGLRPNKQYFVYIVPLFNHSSEGAVRNLTMATQVSDPVTPIHIQTTHKGLNFMHFFWDRNVKVEYFSSVLVNMESGSRSSLRSRQGVAEFAHLDICRKYCLYVTAKDYKGQPEWLDTTCEHTLAPKPVPVVVNNVSSEPTTSRVVSWTYPGVDGCSKSYQVQYRNKHLNLTYWKETNSTQAFLTSLMRNVIYEVVVRAVMSLEVADTENIGDSSRVTTFFTGQVRPYVSGVMYNIDVSRKTLDVSWSLPDNSPGSLFEFLVFVTRDRARCFDAVNMVCDSCPDPFKRRFVDPQPALEWEKLRRCDNLAVDSFKMNTKFFGITINALQPVDRATLVIYGLNLQGAHRLHEKVI